MTKQVRETAAGSKISAFVVLNKRGEQVATVQAHHGSTVTVDVWNDGDKALENTAKVLGRDELDVIHQQGTASGGGYDKFAAALSGLVIDGHVMADHCGRDERTEKMLKAYIKAASKPDFNQAAWDKKAKRFGASFANHGTYTTDGKRLYSVYKDEGQRVMCTDVDGKHEYTGDVVKRFSSLHLEPGLKRLATMGYRVFQAI